MVKKGIAFLFAVLLIAAPVLAGTIVQQIPNENWRIAPVAPSGELDEDEVIFTADFEEGPDWTTSDLTGVGTMWHTSNFNAYEDGTSWWCGDEALEGYNNHWLQYLETPLLDLGPAGGELELTFMMYLDCEAPGGEPAGYDGWDGANVWYSVDGGTTWDVLENPEPAYSSTSLYSFGVEFSMGTGIAGWNGSTEHVWQPVTFDMSDFAGEDNFKLRFAFCSDPAESTPDGGYMCFFVDDILLTDGDEDFLSNDAEGTAVPSDLIPIEQIGNGNTWELQTEESHSADHAWHMSVADVLLCAVISPEIDIPPLEEYPATYMQYWVWCNLLDADGDGNNTLEDYYLIDVSPDGGITWEMVVYDYGYDNGNGNSLDGWVQRTTGLVGGSPTEDIDLTPWAGQTVQIRFRGNTDDNDDGGIGEGLFIDDVEVISTTGLDYDIAVYPPFIPFPTTVGRPVPATVTFANLGNNALTFNSFWSFNGVPNPFDEIYLDPGDDITLYLDPDPDDGVETWVPTDVEQVTFFARHMATPDDNPTNNQTETYPVDVMPEGSYELGYDDRIAVFTTTRFGVGEGPITHFNVPEDFENFNLDSIRVLWNGNFGDSIAAADFNVHVFEGGDTPGPELWTETFTATSLETNPNWHVMDVSDTEELMGLTGDFWLWFEFTYELNDRVYPEIIFSPRSYGDGHHYEYDGVSAEDADADWFIRVVGNTEEASVTETNGNLPVEWAIESAYPNPFNPSVNIVLAVPQTADVRAEIVNILGQRIAVLHNGRLDAGFQNLSWRADNMPSGLYFLRVTSDTGFSGARKLMLLK